eukprot:7885066-Pyramimonas_sp.AAC.1
MGGWGANRFWHVLGGSGYGPGPLPLGPLEPFAGPWRPGPPFGASPSSTWAFERSYPRWGRARERAWR